MRIRSSVLCVLSGVGLCLAQPAAQEIHAKLLTPVTSYSKPGSLFELRLGAPVDFGAPALLPPGTILRGTIREPRRVGLGFKRERSSLALDFAACQVPGHPTATCGVKLLSIENAREEVVKNNQIRGILAASNPNSWFQGLWFKPTSSILRRSPAGLTGPIGTVQNQFAPHPWAAGVIVASRLIFFSLPNPEIELPTGTELILRIAAADSGDHPILPINPVAFQPVSIDESALEELRSAPTEIRNANNETVADIINFAFLGTTEQIEAAFAEAGWTTADPLSRKSFSKSYGAFTSMRCYAKAPVSPLTYQKRLPDLVFQKTFNSMSKRHHIRLWQLPDSPYWLGAATHDVSIGFDWNHMSLTHRIDPQIDRERSKVLNDLTAAGCIDKLTMVQRPNLMNANTDGSLALAGLRTCTQQNAGPLVEISSLKAPRVSPPARAARRLVLETRHYFTRGNAYYWAYKGLRRVSLAALARTTATTGTKPSTATAAASSLRWNNVPRR